MLHEEILFGATCNAVLTLNVVIQNIQGVKKTQIKVRSYSLNRVEVKSLSPGKFYLSFR